MADETAAWAPGSSDPKVAFEEFKLHLREITPRIRVVPVVVALNVLVFGVMVATGISPLNPSVDAVVRWGADYGPRTLAGQPWRILTSVFLHFGIIHLAANMLALLNAGPIIERLFGSAAFAALYLAAGITGSVASLAVHPLVASAGASGAIFGVYGALGAVMLLHRETVPPVALKKLGGVAASFIIWNFSYAIGHNGIDNMAHLGGLAGGALAGGLLFRELVPGRAPALRRPFLIATGALALGAIVAYVLPAPVPFAQIVNDYVADETAALASYRGLMNQVDAGETMPDAARDFHVILSDWKVTRVKLDARADAWGRRKESTTFQRQLLWTLRNLANSRETYWWRMVTALYKQDRVELLATIHEFNQKTQELVEKINELEHRIARDGRS